MNIGNTNSRITVNHKLKEWINQQDVYGWAKYTLEYPYFTRREHFSEPLKQSFAELSHIYPSSKVKRLRKDSDIPVFRHVGLFGGDYSTGVALHFQGLIELFDEDLESLHKKLSKTWASAIARQPHPGNKMPEYVLKERATVWTEKFTGMVDHYIDYLQRYEGKDLSFGVEKIEHKILALSPYCSSQPDNPA